MKVEREDRSDKREGLKGEEHRWALSDKLSAIIHRDNEIALSLFR